MFYDKQTQVRLMGHGPNGQAMVEFIIIFPVLILLTLGTFQVALLYNAKTTLNYATFLAARIGAVNNADKQQIENAFFRGLAPLYTSIDGDLSDVEEVQLGRDKAKQEYIDGFACIERVNPTNEAFMDFGINTDGTIPNNNLMYRTATVGPNSGISIQDANLLKLRITFCPRMIVPFFSTMIKMMADKTDPDGIYINNSGHLYKSFCYQNGRMPMVSQAIVRMQSDIKNDGFSSCNKP